MEKQELEEKKKMICQFLEEEQYVPMKEKELAVMLQAGQKDRPDLKRALKELVAEGKIQVSGRGRYRKAEETVLTGKFLSNAKGFGFVVIEGRDRDLYVPENHVNGAFHGDTVQVTLLPGAGEDADRRGHKGERTNARKMAQADGHGRRQEAQVVAVLVRGITQVVGTFEKNRSFGFVVPDNRKFSSDIFVPLERSKGAVDGHKVVVEITDYGTGGHNPEGRVTEILGHVNDPGVDILSIIRSYELPEEFPERVMTLAERTPECVTQEEKAGRLDLRGLQMVTIDGEDAKDLDDAVSLTVDEKGFHLGVHIADVANYVQENSALDKEALNRGTSVYLVDRVIPMLPHRLSNGICSLNAGEERLALSCLMTIDQKGNVTDYRIEESLICVDRRMSYTGVAKILEQQDEEERRACKEVVPMLENMRSLAAILRAGRRRRGSIDFDFPETKMILDKDGHPLQIKPYERNTATDMIEDFMLIANETVARHFYWQEIPFVYRTHETPDEEKIETLRLFIQGFGYSLKNGREEVHPKELQKLLGKIAGSPEEALITRLTLRSMKQAKYTVECSGHFGLACSYYCHFTSPIRRYPDLQIHRIIKEQLHGRLIEKRLEHYRDILPEVASRSSEMERRADEAERETLKLKKAEFMRDHIGEDFEGVISSITSWGMYVELENTVEGLIHVSTIPGDYFNYDEVNYEMVGRSGKIRYRLGQKIKVTVKEADTVLRTVNFAVAE